MHTNIAVKILEQNGYFESAQRLTDVDGLSSPRVENFLNQLVREMDPGEAYLEVGTFMGRTLLAAAHDNPGRTCIGCDRFRFWGRFTGPGMLARRTLQRNIERYRRSSADIEFYGMTSQELFARRVIRHRIGVYFYDGDHSYGGTFHGVIAGAPFLAERCVLLMDDWNDPVIRKATYDGLKSADLRVLWHCTLPGDHSSLGWWNGLGAFFLEKRRAALRFPLPGRAA